MAARLGNITFDCDDVLGLASFWSAVLGRPLDQGSSSLSRDLGGLRTTWLLLTCRCSDMAVTATSLAFFWARSQLGIRSTASWGEWARWNYRAGCCGRCDREAALARSTLASVVRQHDSVDLTGLRAVGEGLRLCEGRGRAGAREHCCCHPQLGLTVGQGLLMGPD